MRGVDARSQLRLGRGPAVGWRRRCAPYFRLVVVQIAVGGAESGGRHEMRCRNLFSAAEVLEADRAKFLVSSKGEHNLISIVIGQEEPRNPDDSLCRIKVEGRTRWCKQASKACFRSPDSARYSEIAEAWRPKSSLTSRKQDARCGVVGGCVAPTTVSTATTRAPSIHNAVPCRQS